MILIIGAGLAGLSCAKHLTEEGHHVLVLASADQVGGRVRTDLHADGYRLDRGFQVLFSAYPAVRRELTYDALKPRVFEPGALLVKEGKRYALVDPVRKPAYLLADLRNPLISMFDKVRILRLRQQLMKYSLPEIFAGDAQPEGKDESTEQYL
ncbi:MAG TPA: FAD-dependent oxidoreductase, partial [Ktedonobacteraceae bacterium]